MTAERFLGVRFYGGMVIVASKNSRPYRMPGRKSRLVFQALLLSLSLNLIQAGAFFFFAFNRSDYNFFWNFKPADKNLTEEALPLNREYFAAFSQFSFPKLVQALSDDRLIEEGCRVRDLALSVLASSFHFDAARGLGKTQLHKRELVYGQERHKIFTRLHAEDFNALIRFASIEKYPFTSEGLFLLLEQKGIPCDQDLVQLFCQTEEFLLLKNLFERTHLPIKPIALVSLALEGGWEIFFEFVEKQKQQCDLGDKARHAYLRRCLEKNSQTAAYLSLVTDCDYVCRYFSDEELEKLFSLLTAATAEAVGFCQKISHSNRSEPIRELARKQCSFLLEDKALAGRFAGIGELRPLFRDHPPASPSPHTHIIQPGESLWSISRKYGVSVEMLMETNRLQSTVLQPGKTLDIPRKA